MDVKPLPLPSSMLACQITEFDKPYTIHQVPAPRAQDLGENDLLLKVGAASLCHTDFMVAARVFPGTKLPMTASHEGAGTVVALGSVVDDFQLGDRVLAGVSRNRCGRCADCIGPDEQYCSIRGGGIGIQVDGAFAEYLVVDSRNSSLIPDGLDFASTTPLACAGITAWRALRQAIVKAGLKKGQWIGIVGSGGGLGHLAVAFAKAEGLRTVGIDARDDGLAVSRGMGADVVLDAREGTKAVVGKAKEATGLVDGVPATVNFSDAKSAAGLACAVTAKHGHMIQVAQPTEVAVPFQELIFRNIHISGSLLGSKTQVGDMLAFVAKHNIAVTKTVYYGLREIPQLIKDTHAGKIKGKGVVVLGDPAPAL